MQNTRGDECLVQVAKILQEQIVRAEDLLARYGGEEFLAILGETDLEGALIFAQKVCKHVGEAKFMYQNQRIKVTVSAGVSVRSKFPSK